MNDKNKLILILLNLYHAAFGIMGLLQLPFLLTKQKDLEAQLGVSFIVYFTWFVFTVVVNIFIALGMVTKKRWGWYVIIYYYQYELFSNLIRIVLYILGLFGTELRSNIIIMSQLLQGILYSLLVIYLYRPSVSNFWGKLPNVKVRINLVLVLLSLITSILILFVLK